jgi:hypothetical protein
VVNEIYRASATVSDAQASENDEAKKSELGLLPSSRRRLATVTSSSSLCQQV